MRLIRPRSMALALICVAISDGSQSRSAPSLEATNIEMAVTDGDPSEYKTALISGGRLTKDEEFTVLFFVKNPKAGHKGLLRLPKGMTFAAGEQAVKDIQQENGKSYGQISWRVKASATGEYTLNADLKSRGGIKLGTANDKVVIRKGPFCTFE